MKTLTFQGGLNPDDTFEYQSGKSVKRGEQFTVSDGLALELLTNPAYAPLIAEVEQELNKLSRSKLDELAAEVGLDPEAYKTKDELVAAINDPDQHPINQNPGGVV